MLKPKFHFFFSLYRILGDFLIRLLILVCAFNTVKRVLHFLCLLPLVLTDLESYQLSFWYWTILA